MHIAMNDRIRWPCLRKSIGIEGSALLVHFILDRRIDRANHKRILFTTLGKFIEATVLVATQLSKKEHLVSSPIQANEKDELICPVNCIWMVSCPMALILSVLCLRLHLYLLCHLHGKDFDRRSPSDACSAWRHRLWATLCDVRLLSNQETDEQQHHPAIRARIVTRSASRGASKLFVLSL